MVGELKARRWQEVPETAEGAGVSSKHSLPLQRESLLSLLSLIVISRDFATFNTLYDVVAISIFLEN